MSTTAAPPDCGHFRHWNDGVRDPGTGDWETCDECGKLVCFDLNCRNGWQWEDGDVVGYHHDDDEPDDGKVLIAGVLYDAETLQEADPQ